MKRIFLAFSISLVVLFGALSALHHEPTPKKADVEKELLVKMHEN